MFFEFLFLKGFYILRLNLWHVIIISNHSGFNIATSDCFNFLILCPLILILLNSTFCVLRLDEILRLIIVRFWYGSFCLYGFLIKVLFVIIFFLFIKFRNRLILNLLRFFILWYLWLLKILRVQIALLIIILDIFRFII